jgi:ketosteroid isomerase-like protein
MAAAGSLWATSAAAQPKADAALAVVKTFSEAMARSDFKALFRTLTPDVRIVDEVPPYRWEGRGAAKAWLKDWGSFAAAKRVVVQGMVFADPARVEVQGDRAYVTRSAVFVFKRGDVRVSETGMLGAALARTPAGWRITAWSWAGTAPK